MEIRRASKSDIKEINKLNEAEVPHVTSISEKDWLHLLEIASNFVVLEHERNLLGFMVTIRERENYDSFNYQFFDNHFEKFEYVDRIVISKQYQGKGLGRKLYEYLFETNKTNVVTCEVNVKPENPNSLAFHKKMGFKEKSKMVTNGGEKVVSLLVRQSD
tara:strand:- start:91 stop:570 length:480 start_codon:yes stop_codon:yes gene_type:complete